MTLGTRFGASLAARVSCGGSLRLTYRCKMLIPLRFDSLGLACTSAISRVGVGLRRALVSVGLSMAGVNLTVTVGLGGALPVKLGLSLMPLSISNGIVRRVRVNDMRLPTKSNSRVKANDRIGNAPIRLSVGYTADSSLTTLSGFTFHLSITSNSGSVPLNNTRKLRVDSVMLRVVYSITVSLGG